MKAALLTSLVLVLVESLTLTSALLVAVFGTVQLNVPVAALVPADICIQLVPLLVLYSNFTLLILALVQVIFWIAPIFHTSPPLGAVTVTLGATLIVKTALLLSVTVLSDTSLTLTKLVTLAVFGIVQLKVPDPAGVLDVTTVQFVPLLVEYSILTLLTFALVQVIFWALPIFHTSVPLGLVTVTLGTTMLKTALLASLIPAFDASLTLTSVFTLGVFGTVQVKLPVAAGVLGVTTIQPVPLLVEYSIFTLLTFTLTQVIL